MPQIPSLLRMILRMEPFAHFTEGIDPLRPSLRSVDGSKVTDHHALILTGNYPGELSPAEERVYCLIAGRMLESFAPRCEKEINLVEAECCGQLFRSRSTETTKSGWRGVFGRSEERGEEEDDCGAAGMDFTEGEKLPVMGHSTAKRKTQPKPLYTEATLLGAMEAAGKHIADEKSREAVKECGIGTPATRAAIMETLLSREYIQRSGKSLLPTEKGLALYKAVKDMRIADAELTGSWEQSLAAIAKGEMNADTFMKAIAVYTRQVTAEVLSLDIRQPPADRIECPKCHRGDMKIYHKIAKCSDPKCGLVVYRRFLNKELTDQQLRQLLSKGRTNQIKGFHGKGDKTFDAQLAFDKRFNLTFRFPDKKGKPVAKGKAKPKSGPGSRPSGK